MDGKDIRLKHKVQLRKKVADAPQQLDLPGKNSLDSAHKGKWILWAAAIAIACLLGFWLFSKSEPRDEDIIDAGSIEATAANTPDAPALAIDSSNASETLAEESLAEQMPAQADAPIQNGANAIALPELDAEAMKVIRGEYGIGLERKEKLGSKYQPVQNRVNEMKSEGVF